MVRELVEKNRSYRRFYEKRRIPGKTLVSLVDLARLSASGGNRQCLKFIVENDEEMTARVFQTLIWAGYLQDWQGPEPGERPSGYIVILEDLAYGGVNDMDVGIAAQSILLGAVELGYGGCMIGSIRRAELSEILGLGGGYEIKLVIALGRPKEKVVIEDIPADGDIKYYRDKKNVHHVPKRKLDDIIL